MAGSCWHCQFISYRRNFGLSALTLQTHFGRPHYSAGCSAHTTVRPHQILTKLLRSGPRPSQASGSFLPPLLSTIYNSYPIRPGQRKGGGTLNIPPPNTTLELIHSFFLYLIFEASQPNPGAWPRWEITDSNKKSQSTRGGIGLASVGLFASGCIETVVRAYILR